MLPFVLTLTLLTGSSPNVVFAILDDVGKEVGLGTGFMPELDALASQGLVFENYYAQPVCSPFRASLLTGTQPHAHGMTSHLDTSSEFGGPDLEWPTIFDAPGYTTLQFGKWHASRHLPDHNFLGPVLYGCDAFAGTKGNLTTVNEDYFDWTRYVSWCSTGGGWGAVNAQETTYSTQRITDDALAAIPDLVEPFFLVVSYHAAHHPFQPPIPPGPIGQRAKYELLVADLDAELGRLAGGVDLSDTLLVISSDNGTPATVTDHPNQSKATVFEPGINVPCVVLGPGVRVGSTDALVSVVDWMPTLWDLSGNTPPALPGEFHGEPLTALLSNDIPHHDYIYAEIKRPLEPPYDRHTRAVRDERYKLVRDLLAGTDSLYDLETDPGEDNPIPCPCLVPGVTPLQEAAYLDLVAQMDLVP